MKKLTLIFIILLLFSCGSLKKETVILKENIELVRKKYPKANVSQHRYFSYVFKVQKEKSVIFVIVDKEKNIKVTKEIN